MFLLRKKKEADCFVISRATAKHGGHQSRGLEKLTPEGSSTRVNQIKWMKSVLGRHNCISKDPELETVRLVWGAARALVPLRWDRGKAGVVSEMGWRREPRPQFRGCQLCSPNFCKHFLCIDLFSPHNRLHFTAEHMEAQRR